MTIDTGEVRVFIDRLAPGWDESLVRNEEVIRLILENAGITEGRDILDVGTGTGVLIPDCLSRKVSSVTGIDLSPEMIRIAESKFAKDGVTFISGDAEKTDFGRLFDCIVIYNAFPHFRDPEGLISHLASFLKPGGILTVAHGMSREKINARHHEGAKHVSNGLMEAEELVEIFRKHLSVTVCVSDDRMYQVAGKKN